MSSASNEENEFDSDEESSNSSSGRESKSDDVDIEVENTKDTRSTSEESENNDKDEDAESGSNEHKGGEGGSNEDGDDDEDGEGNSSDENVEGHSNDEEDEDVDEDGEGNSSDENIDHIDNDRYRRLMSIALDVGKGIEIPSEKLQEIRTAADELNNCLEQRHVRYILCANAAEHCGFIEPNYFGKLTELLLTDNVIIRQCIMWAFASILPCKNILSPLLIRLLYRSLKNEALGWSISYLFRKMSEYDKYVAMITCSMWISMSKLLFDRNLSEQIRTTIVYTLNNVYKIRKWVSPVIKERFEQLVKLDGIETQVLVATVNALYSMAISGAHLDEETISRLRHLATSSDSSSMESVHELLDFLDNKRILSKASTYMSGSNIKKELTATQNTSISRSEEESVEPTVKLHSMDHLLNTIGHLGRTFNAESKPTDVPEGHNQAWYRTTWQEVSNLATLAKEGKLKDQDFDYLAKKFDDGSHWSAIPWTSREEIYDIIASAFRDAAAVEQTMPRIVLDIMIKRLSGTNNTIHRKCAETLLFVMKNRRSLSEQQMENIEEKLKLADDTIVKQHLIELYALYVSEGHHFKLNLDSIAEDLLNETTCKTTSYLFFKAAAIEKRTFSQHIMNTLCKVAESKRYDCETRDNCLWAVAYSIKETNDKASISTDILETLGELLADPEKNVKQTAAIALCYYGTDEKTSLSTKILEQLAEMLNDIDYGLLNNILSVYLRMSKQKEKIPSIVLTKLCPLFFHEDFSIREKAIWILKHVVDNRQNVKLKIIDHVDECLKDSEFGIRNVAAVIFNSFWRGRLNQNDQKVIRILSVRMENFMSIIFHQAFSLDVQLSSLDLLQSLVKHNFVLSEILVHLIECCLYDRESSISSKSISILQIYSKEHYLPKTTVVCLEHLLTTETPILSEVISILKSIVANGHRLSKKTIDILAQLLFKTSEPKQITVLLTHADRNQPLSKNIDELLRQIYFGGILEHSTCATSLNKATNELFRSTSQGQPLSASVLDLLIRKLESNEQRSMLMPILLNVVSNGQSLSNDHYRSVLENIFFENTDSPSINLVEILTHLTRQNQIISDEIIRQLKEYLNNQSINHFVIEIYQHLVERQKPLDKSIIANIFQLFFNRQQWELLNADLQPRLALFYKAVADNRPKEIDQNCLPFLLTSNQLISVRKEICTAIRLLTEHEEKLQETTINVLINLIDGNDDADLQQIALEILTQIRATDTSIDENTSTFLNLLQYDNETDDRTLLEQLKHVGKIDMNLPKSLSVRLSHMLYSCDLQVKMDAAMILTLAVSKKKILSKQVLDIIYMTLLDETINVKTLPLLLSNQSSEPLPTSVIDDLLYLVSRSSNESVRQCAKKILATQMNKNQTKINLFFEYLNSKMLIKDETDFRQTLKITRAMIVIEKQLPVQLVSSMAEHFSDEYQDEIIDVLLLAHQHNVQFHQYQRIISSIELALSKNSKPKLIELIGILANNAVTIQENTQTLLFDIFIRDKNENALKALEYIGKHQKLPQYILMFFVEFISKSSNEVFISRAFSIIHQQVRQGFIDDSTKIIQAIPLPPFVDINRLMKMNSFEKSLSIIQNIVFVNYLQPDVFERSVEQWSRDCLCIEIVTNCSDKTNDRIISFYQHLTHFEQVKHYEIFNHQRDAFLRDLIEKQRSEGLQLSTINDILIYATTSIDDTPLTILHSDQTDWLMKMRLCYIETKLKERFRHLQYQTSLVSHLVQRIAEQEQLLAEFIELCLRNFRSADDALMFLDLFISFAVTSTDLPEIFFHEHNPTDFDTLYKKMQLLIVGKTLKLHWIGSNVNITRTRTSLQTLIQQGWTVSKLLVILKANGKTEMSSDATETLTYLNDILKIFIDYNVNSNIISNLQSIFEQKKVQLWPSLVFNRVIEHCFGSGSSEKNLNTLLSELDQLNPQIDRGDLLIKYETIESTYKSKSKIISEKKSIESWSKSLIQQWATHVRTLNSSNQPSMFEIIAVIKRAVYLDSNFEPRPIQVLAVLILLEKKGPGGRLVQILTGEGKSTVVSILAVIKALQNQHVDIITSSINLAKRDAHEKKPFYDYFKVTVAHNNDEISYTSGPKSCYQADVVYGNSSQFQFDLLRHEFSLLNSRSLDKDKGLSRRFDAVIIDEVDSMLIDENNTLARLADQLPGMEWLSSLLYGIWRCIDLEANPESKRDVIIDSMRKLLTDPKSDLKLPTHLHSFVHESIPVWIDHAILAKVEYRLDHHYMIKPDETRIKRIMPIDFSNTGIVQASTTWSDGLHQFLQIKHGLKMTPLTVTTNYLSNIGLFTLYGENIYGLTGTIGSKDAQNLLYRIYNVDTIIIPPFKQKRHMPLKTILTENDDDWLKTIVSETINNSRKQRGVLVICETRLDAKTISKQLQRADPTCLIRLYTDNTDAVESNVVGNRIQNGEIIVATNLAGRGTDLKTSPNVEKNGGLHVCLTSLPNNLRVEEQAFGRTSRQGNRGTSQMILSRERTLRQLMNNYPEYKNTRTEKFSNSIDLIRDWRKQAERMYLERMWRDEIVDIKLKDKLFQRFCKLLAKLREQNDNAYRLLSVKEQWGLWLKSMDYVTQNRLALRLFLERQGSTSEDVPQDGHSFFHALSRQIDGELTADQMKNEVIQHMLNYPDSYTNITEEERHQATSEALQMNLIIYRTDSRSEHIYQRDDAVHTCVLGYEVGSYYFSIRLNQFDDAKRTTKENDSKQKSRRQKWSDRLKSFTDQFKEKKNILSKQLSTRIIDHNLETGFTTFEKQMTNDYHKSDFIRNPCYLLLEVDTIISKLSTWTNSMRSCVEVLPWTEKKSVTYQDAIDRLEKAIELDPIFTFTAQVNCAHFLIDQQKTTSLYKVKAKSYLVRAQEIIGKYILPQLHSMQLETKKNDEELMYDDLVNQIRLKVEILQMYQEHVNQAIAIIEDSQKLIDVTVTDKSGNGAVTVAKKLYDDELDKFFNQSSGTVTLSFHSLKCHQDVWEHDQALKLLEMLRGNDEHVSIHFLEGSKEKINELESVITCKKIRLNIEYLDSNEIDPMIKLSEKVDLKLAATKEDYLKVIKEIHQHVNSSSDSPRTHEKVSTKNCNRHIAAMNENIELITNKYRLPLTTVEILKTLEDDSILVESILFKSVIKEQVDFIISHVNQPSFTLTFHSLTIDCVKSIVENVTKPFNYELYSLSIIQAKEIIEKITHRNFLLLITDLSVERAQYIINNFHRQEQDVKSTLKRLAENFSKVDQQYEELNAYGLLGVSLLISIDELNPRPWISVTIVVALGVGQIIGGICLVALTGGLGISLGISLIGEGVNDIVFGVRGALSRRFSWKDYAIQKGVSLAICFCTLGFSAVAQAAKGAQAVGVTGTASVIQATRQGTVAVFKNSFRIVGSGTLKDISSNSWLLACKQLVVTCGETGARELGNYFSGAAYQGVLSQIKSTIRDEIESIMRIKQTDQHYQGIFNRALTVDRYYNRDEWHKQMEQIAMNILTKNKDQFIETVQSLSKGVTNAFLNHSRQFLHETGDKGNYGGYMKAAQLMMTIGRMLKGASEIGTLTDFFFTQYKKELNLLGKKIPTIEDLLLHASQQEMSLSTTESIVEALVKQSIITSDGLLHARFIQDNDEEPNFNNTAGFLEPSEGSARTPKEKLLKQLRKVKFEADQHRICAESVLIKIISGQNHRSVHVSMFQKQIVDMLTDQVCAIIYGTMVVPMTNYVISRTVASISTLVQLKLNPDGTVAEQLMEEGAKRYIHGVANDFVEKYEKGELQVDPEANQKLEKLVERCETQGGKPETVNEELALGVTNGKQGGVIELCVMAILTKKPITVLQQQLNGEANENDGSIQMVYTPPTVDKETGKIIDGHYELASGTMATGGPNDCLYTAILSQAQDKFTSAVDMRTQCAAFILTNPGFIAGLHPALSIINQTRNPIRWKQLMGEGGAKKAPFIYREERCHQNVDNLKEANREIVKDMLDFVDSSELDGTSTDAKHWIKSVIKEQLASFHEENKKGVVEMELKITVPSHGNRPDINLGFTINADEANPDLKQQPHYGCNFYKKGNDKWTGHKYVSEKQKPKYHRTRSSRQPDQIKDPQIKELLPNKQVVTMTKTISKYNTGKK